jgi:hypothetical protein
VRLTCVHHDRIARAGDHLLFADRPRGLTLDDVDDLIVVVFVETNAPPRFAGVHQEKRDARRTLLASHELMRHPDKRQHRLTHHMHGNLPSGARPPLPA